MGYFTYLKMVYVGVITHLLTLTSWDFQVDKIGSANG